MGITAAILSGASTVFQGVSASQQAGAQAKINEQQAASQRQISEAEADDFNRRQSAVLAQRRAEGGASGIDLGTGSALLAAQDFAAETSLQALRIRAGGRIKASRLEQQAALTRRAGQNALFGGVLRGGSQLLSGNQFFNKKPSLGNAVGTDLFISPPGP